MEGRKTADGSSLMSLAPGHAEWDLYWWLLGQHALEIPLIVTLSMTAVALLASGSDCGMERGSAAAPLALQMMYDGFQVGLIWSSVGLAKEEGWGSRSVRLTETFAQRRKKFSWEPVCSCGECRA